MKRDDIDFLQQAHRILKRVAGEKGPEQYTADDAVKFLEGFLDAGYRSSRDSTYEATKAKLQEEFDRASALIDGKKRLTISKRARAEQKLAWIARTYANLVGVQTMKLVAV